MTGVPSSQGFYGKLPALGDFVGRNLPRSVIDPWHAWLQSVLPASRELLGDSWRDVWMEAPIWRFSLQPGSCGSFGLVGLWMPSIDRAGREFPLMVAATLPDKRLVLDSLEHDPWLETAELAALDALSKDLPPDTLAARLDRDGPALVPPHVAGTEDLWWTSGSPLVAAGYHALTALPDAHEFAAMLDARHALACSTTQ